MWIVSVWRLASFFDSLKFKFVPGQVYYFQAGHRYWVKDNVAAATQSSNSEYLSFQFFQFDGATSTILELGVLTTSIVLLMF